MRRARVIAGVVCVVLAALLPTVGVILQLRETPNWYRPRDDDVSAFERRYVELRRELAGETPVGYLAPSRLDPAARKAHLYMTRYVLAPTLVRDGPMTQLVVADLVGDASELPRRYIVRRNFGNGLLLLERRQ